MRASFDNFIGVFEDAYPADFCDYIVERAEKAFSGGFGDNRDEAYGCNANDTQLFSYKITADHILTANDLRRFNGIFWDVCYKTYADKYKEISGLERHYMYGIKIQKTNPCEGYHVWHSEQTGKQSNGSARVLAWTLYLNDVEEGGETEFLYQSRRIKPKKGTMVLWPAGFTHTHRGNPPLKETKYLATGWVEF